MMSIGPLGSNISENLIEVLTFSFRKMRLKVSSAQLRPYCLGLNVLKDIIDFQGCQFYHKLIHSLFPDYFTIFFTLNNHIHNYDTRSCDLHRFSVNKSCTNLCIRHYIPILFNNLPIEDKKRLLFHMAVNYRYSSECHIRDCYVCGLSSNI